MRRRRRRNNKQEEDEMEGERMRETDKQKDREGGVRWRSEKE